MTILEKSEPTYLPADIVLTNDRGVIDAQWTRKPSGFILCQIDAGFSEARWGKESAWKEVAMTLQCPHCGDHFLSSKGSGIQRAFCYKHMAVTCGKPACRNDCIDFRKHLDGEDLTKIVIASA